MEEVPLTYDINGLIINGTKLEASDIPEITIDHINGLRRLLDEKIGNTEFERLRIEASNFNTSLKPSTFDIGISGISEANKSDTDTTKPCSS